MTARPTPDAWPDLPYAAWRDSCASLQLWMQIIGKLRLARTPWLNHSWHVPFYLTARGLTTSPIPDGDRCFEIAFDFLDHQLQIVTTTGDARRLALRPQTVADFYAAVMSALAELGIVIAVNELPCEIAAAIPFSRDRTHGAYDGEYAQRFWRALLRADRVLKQFRTAFLGKCSPVHFFWGSFDLAVTRFSGRAAPPFTGRVPGVKNQVMRDAYSEEVSSAGFWPGGDGVEYAAFYSYAYPEPAGFSTAKVEPATARYDETLGQFILPYDAVRAATDPDAMLRDFLQSTSEAAARNGEWERSRLECAPGRPGVPRAVTG